MSCPILTKWRNSPLGTHSKKYLQLLDFTEELEEQLWTRLPNIPMEDFQRQLGEKLYYLVGSALSAKREWNKMTFLQLEHEARVLGFLGPNEENFYTAWELRLKIACEAKKHEIWVGYSESQRSRQRAGAAC